MTTGTEFAAAYRKTVHGPAREALVLAAARAAAFRPPTFTRIDTTAPNGSVVSFFASDDYFAIGDDDDFMRVPMAAPTAQTLADELAFALPTPRMVDRIAAAATVVLTPSPIANGPQLSLKSGDPAANHNATIEAARAGRTGLLCGAKKDVCVGLRMLAPSDSGAPCVVIYGWHPWSAALTPKPGGVVTPGMKLLPVQGYSGVHEATYEDYSHGVRPCATFVLVDGAERALADVLADPVLAPALSHEGPVKGLRYGTSAGGGASGAVCNGIAGACPLPSGAPAAAPPSRLGVVARAAGVAAAVGGLTLVAWRYA